MRWFLGEMRTVLDGIPGITYALTQPIDMRVQEMIIGARGDVVVKVFGDDIASSNRVARDVAAAIRTCPGAIDVFALRNAGMRYFTVAVDRAQAGRFGLNAERGTGGAAGLGRRPPARHRAGRSGENAAGHPRRGASARLRG